MKNHSLIGLDLTEKPKVFKGEISKNPFKYFLIITTYIQYIYTYIIYNNNNKEYLSSYSIGNFFFMTLLNRRGVYI
jgi:hypothetical protein